MTTPHDDLHARLAVLAETRVADGGPPAPPTDVLWRAGSRRRWRVRAAAGAVVAVVLLLVVGAFVPIGGVPEAVPATAPGEPLPSYPEHVAMPWSPPRTATPGPSAIAVGGANGEEAGAWLVGPTGGVSFLPLRSLTGSGGGFGGPEERLAVSPDGHWLATGAGLHDLVSGRDIGVALDSGGVPADVGWESAPWWSPDSRRVLYSAGPGSSAGEGLVVDLAGTTAVVPPAGVGDALVLAGWRDDSTVIAVWRKGAEEFLVMTWTLGDEQWTNGPTISWPGWEEDWPQAPDTVGSERMTAAAVSPDGSQVVLLGSVNGAVPGTTDTRAQVFDSSTGALVGFPVGDVPAADAGWTAGSSVDWPGWGCRIGWRNGGPVVTDDGAFRPAGDPDGGDLVTLPPPLAGGCPALAGNELQGTPLPNTAALWAQRLRTWGLPLAGLVAVLALAWWWSRRRGGWTRPLPRLPFIYPTAGTGGR
ncbi:MAG TPA: hypothetical protein VFL46_08410 [Phycicoccus sp.]|nr:hypothetical protein [Phycicoccus sp.]